LPNPSESLRIKKRLLLPAFPLDSLGLMASSPEEANEIKSQAVTGHALLLARRMALAVVCDRAVCHSVVGTAMVCAFT
jgi:hypothetical protein